MSSLNFSIWGIRDGFELNGMLHTHNISSLKSLQRDRFRDLANMVGGDGFFMIHRKGGDTMISFVNTKIKEARTSSQTGRPGHVVFSLILQNNLQLNQSPRLILQAISAFYVDCVKDGTRNNFVEEEIRHFLSGLTTRPISSSAPLVEGSFYSFHTDEKQLDEFLTGNASLANLSEWILIYNERDENGIYPEMKFWEGAFGIVPEYFDFAERRSNKEKNEALQRVQVIEDLKKSDEQSTKIKSLEENIEKYLSQKYTHEALKLWNASPYKLNVSAGLTARLKSAEQDKQNNQVTTQQQKEDLDSLAQLNRSFQHDNLDDALKYFNKLHNKNHPLLNQDIKQKVLNFANEKQLEQKKDEEEDLKIRIKQEKNKRFKKQISLAIIGLVLITSVLSYFTMVPAFLWDGDGDGFHTYRTDNCPDKSGKTCMGCPDTDKDGIADLDDACPNIPGKQSAKGCPDADGDSVKDADDNCSSVRGTVGCNGCPDGDNDNTADSIDKCPTVSGSVSNDGCAEDAVKYVEKPNATKAIKVPSDFGNYIIKGKWLKFIDEHYEYSDYEKKDYKDVEDQETVNKLNKYYQLKGSLKKEGGGGGGPVVQDPPKIKIKLTQAEQTELNGLIDKATKGTLNPKEKSRKITLEKKLLP